MDLKILTASVFKDMRKIYPSMDMGDIQSVAMFIKMLLEKAPSKE